MTAYDDALHAATQAGGDPQGWPEDAWSMIVWAAIGCGDWPDTAPHAQIADQRQRGGSPAIILGTLAPTLHERPPAVVLAAAFAGLARWATNQRDAVIGRAVVSLGRGVVPPPGTVGAQQMAAAVGLSRPAVNAIVARENDRG